MKRASIFLFTSFALMSLCASIAQAHPKIDEAVEHYEQAEFERAVGAFAEAEEADDLTRDDVVRLLSIRAQVHFAMENNSAMEEDLARLAAVAPDHSMGREVPPQVSEAFTRLASEQEETPLGLNLVAAGIPSGVRITPDLTGAPPGLIRSVRIHGRAIDGEWSEGMGELSIPSASGAEVEYWGEAVGIGGAVLVASGSASDPLRQRGGAPLDHEGGDDEDGEFPVVPILISAGAVAAIAAVVVVVMVATSGGESDDTQFGPPMILGR